MKRIALALVALLTSFDGLATTVTSLADDGPGSLREAIALGGDIDFAVTGTITLTSGPLVIHDSIAINGPGADQLAIARSSAPGTPEFRVLSVNGNVTISGVTFRNGLVGTTDGYENGGGVLVKGALTLRNCAVTDHRSVGGWTRGTGVYVGDGARLTAVNCLFAGNAGEGFSSEGSAIYNYGALALTNCTFSGNSAGYSAAIQNDAFSDDIVIDSCTIFGNTARFAPALMNGVNAAMLLRNSIVAGNSAWDGDWEIESRGFITSAGYNLIGFVYHGPGMDPVPPHPTDHTNLSANAVRLAPLANNGGPTHTHALLTNSPAFNAGPTNNFPATDQRGVDRPQHSRADIGAFEAQTFGPAPTNHPPVAHAQSVTARIGTPLPITLTGFDPDGDALTYTITTLPVWGMLSGTPPDVIYTPATNSPGWDLFAFKVNDGKADSASAGVHVTVLPTEPPATNKPPTARIVSPASGTTFTAPANVVLIASVQDPDGTAAAATVEFFEGTRKLGEGQLFDPGPPHDAPFRFNWTNVPPGEYTLIAKITDDHGAMAVSDPVHISVLGGPLPELSFRLAFNHPNHTAGVFFQDYTLNGPVGRTLLLPADRVVPDESGRHYYGAKPHQMWRVDSQTGAVQQMDPGSSLPELSWPMGVAFDNQRNRVLLTSLGGEGFLYAYSPSSNQWSLVRSMNDRDLDCLEYHASLDAFFGVKVSWAGGGPAAIYRFGADGAFQGEIALLDLPFGIGPAGYWSELVSVGDYLVLLLEADPVYDPYGESRIYLIDPRNGDVRLTYQKVRPRPNLPPSVQINSPTAGELFSAPAEIPLVAYAQDPEDSYNLTVEFFEGTNSLGLGTFVPTLCPSPHCPNFAFTWSNVPPGQYKLTAKARDTGGAAAVSSPVRITVYDPALSIVTLRATDTSASEAGDTGTFTVQRDGNTNEALTVYYSIGGTASNGVDYVALEKSVDLPAGIRTATILVVPIDDSLAEGPERVELRLAPPPVLPSPYVIVSPSNAVVTLFDNEPPPPRPVVTIQATDPVASEAAGDPGQFTVYRTGPTNESLSVFCAFGGTASNGEDYTRLPNTLVIPAGSGSAAITVVPIDDALGEGIESVVATLYYPPIPGPFPLPYVIGSPSNAVVTIQDNDPAPTNPPPFVRIFSPTNGGTFTAPANIGICAIASDYVATVEFFAGDRSLGVLTNYCHPPDCVYIMEPTYCLVWSNVPPGLYTLTAQATDIFGASSVSDPVHVSVQEPSRLPRVSVRATDADAREPGDNGMFTIYRTGPTNSPLSVYYYSFWGTASNGMDYLTLPNVPVWPRQASVRIPAGARSVDVLIVPVNDNLAEGPETVVLRLAGCPGVVACYDIDASDSAVIILRDDEPAPTNTPPILTIYATDPLASEPGVLTIMDHGVFTIYRSGNTNTTLLAQYAVSGSASNGVDYSALTNAVVIPAGQVSANVVINPLLDNWSESTEAVMLRLSDPPCRATVPRPPDCYEVGLADRDIVFIADNHLPPPANNHPPTVHIFTPTNGASFIAPADIFIAAQAQDLDGYWTIQFVEFLAGTTSLGIRTNYPTMDPVGPFRLPWTNVPPGEYVLSAKAVDDKGAIGVSLPVNIRVVATNPPPSNLPIVTIAALQPDRSFHLMQPGANGTWWRIECSTDMVHWTPLSTNLVTEGALHFVDPDAAELPQRFYRALPEPNPPPE